MCDCKAVREAKEAEKRAAAKAAKRCKDSVDNDDSMDVDQPKEEPPPSAPQNGDNSSPRAPVETEAQIAQELSALESWRKQPADGDVMDQTEIGFALRAQAARELFDDDQGNPSSAEPNAETSLADTNGDEEAPWEPW
ncbi:hypothetical protein DL93DRAFT_2072477 [Clavulina sp. PMI_390]|nr:hypothetical protein DL93DRAFT_2072477 [Clavulina sp. PMI_390]